MIWDSGRCTICAVCRITAIALAVIGTVYFLCVSFRAGWTHNATDFPNYYTAAHLVRSGQHHLREFYDWTWFQRQMNYAGIEKQIGAYTPQTPLTMMPMTPFAGFAPQTAKRIWLVLSAVLLAWAVGLLSRAGHLRIEYMAILALSGYTSLRTNFLLGQYYVFLLFLLTATFYLFAHKRPIASGVVAGLAFALKLYGGPLLLFFVAKRCWRAVAGMVLSSAAAVIVATAIFGWADVHFYAVQILPRTLQGGSTDPYNPGNPTLATLLHRLFLAEAELNPRPLLNAPWLFYVLQPLANFVIIVFTSLAVGLNRKGSIQRDFALFAIALVLLSTSIGSYTFLLLLLPISLCLEEAGTLERILLVAAYILVNAPLPGGRLFPKVWILFFLLVTVGRHYWLALTPRIVAGALVSIAIATTWSAHRAIANHRGEPAQRFRPIAIKKGAIFSAFPAISRAGMFFQALANDRYILRWQHDSTVEDLPFDGQVFHPFAPNSDGPVVFELVAHGTSQMMKFDPATRKIAASSIRLNTDAHESAISPDHHLIAFTSDATGTQQIYIQNVDTREVKRLTSGYCNNSSPTWELDGKAIVFASDCDRAVGLPALYRAEIEK